MGSQATLLWISAAAQACGTTPIVFQTWCRLRNLTLADTN